MNKQRLLDLADTIERGVEGLVFDMNAFEDPRTCGTAACVGGWAMFLALGMEFPKDRDVYAESVAQEWLDLTNDEVENLFYPNCFSHLKSTLYPQVDMRRLVAAELRDMARFGEIDPEWCKHVIRELCKL